MRPASTSRKKNDAGARIPRRASAKSHARRASAAVPKASGDKIDAQGAAKTTPRRSLNPECSFRVQKSKESTAEVRGGRER